MLRFRFVSTQDFVKDPNIIRNCGTTIMCGSWVDKSSGDIILHVYNERPEILFELDKILYGGFSETVTIRLLTKMCQHLDRSINLLNLGLLL